MPDKSTEQRDTKKLQHRVFWLVLMQRFMRVAMTALGTETSIDKFRQAGAKPFVLAGLLYVWLVAGGYFVTKYLVGIL